MVKYSKYRKMEILYSRYKNKTFIYYIMKKKELYKPFKSSAKNKKYSVYVKGPTGKPKIVHFGDSRYAHYKDTTGVGAWTNKDHNDKERRKKYRARAGKIKDKEGKLTIKNKDTANWWAYHKLW